MRESNETKKNISDDDVDLIDGENNFLVRKSEMVAREEKGYFSEQRKAYSCLRFFSLLLLNLRGSLAATV